VAATKKVYVDFDPEVRYPVASDRYWECLQCGMTLPSIPPDACHCLRRNIMLDIGRVKVQDHSKAKLFRKL
jgi:hypothetical protein